jgi:hypothetical protein
VYVAVVLAWPFPPPPRFFVPVLPLILLAAWDGVRGSVALAWARRVAVVGAAVLFVAAGAGAFVRLRDARTEPSLHRYEWIRNHTAPDDVVACVLDPNCYLYTQRKAVSIAIAEVAPFYSKGGTFAIRMAKLAEMLEVSGARWVMVEPFPGARPLEQLARGAVDKLQELCPGLLEEAWRDDQEGSVVYRLRAERRTPNVERPTPEAVAGRY